MASWSQIICLRRLSGTRSLGKMTSTMTSFGSPSMKDMFPRKCRRCQGLFLPQHIYAEIKHFGNCDFSLSKGDGAGAKRIQANVTPEYLLTHYRVIDPVPS